MIYVILTFAVVFLLIGSGLLFLSHREVLGNRLADVLSPGAKPDSPPRLADRIGIRQRAESLTAFAGSFRKAETPADAIPTGIVKKLIAAGYRGENAAHIFSMSKLITPPVLCAITLVTGLYLWNPFLVIVLSLGMGYLVPDYWLDYRVRAREEEIRQGLPDMLDMLVVCLEAGLSLDQAALRSSQELRSLRPSLADEIGLVMLEVRAGRPRLDAWKRMAQRTGVDVIEQMVSILVQADQFGTGVSKALRTHGEAMRSRRRLKMEELTAKSTVKMVFPLVMFIFPPFLIVVMAPAVLSIIDALK